MIAVPEALLKAITDDPADDLARLAYADWCEESGQAERAEFIRLQVALAPVHADPERMARWIAAEASQHKLCSEAMDGVCCCRWCVQAREVALLVGSPTSWGANGEFSGWLSGVYPGHDLEGVEWAFARGFVSGVKLPQDAWLEHGPAVIEAHPVQVVQLSDKEAWGDNVAFYWYEELPGVPMPWSLDPGIFRDLLALGHRQAYGGEVPFTTAEAASFAASMACLAYASREARKRRRKGARRAAHP